jgi:hypothetical protein
MKTTNPYQRIGLLLVGLVVSLGLTGCYEKDTVVYVDDNPPAVPTGVYTITGDGEVEVLWYPVREDDVDGYGVYRSFDANGAYQRIATLRDPLADYYVDRSVQNGQTYYYAVDAFDRAGHESALSYETAFDTPRPAGTGIVVYAQDFDDTRSGIDFSDYHTASFVTDWDALDANIYFHRLGNVLYAKGWLVGVYWNDIQDLGYTDSMDEVSWAPTMGWSVAPNGVELIEGHTYVVWTHDSYFAKFRVTDLLGSPSTPSGARIDWAYQIDVNNPELRPLSGKRNPEREAS